MAEPPRIHAQKHLLVQNHSLNQKQQPCATFFNRLEIQLIYTCRSIHTANIFCFLMVIHMKLPNTMNLWYIHTFSIAVLLIHLRIFVLQTTVGNAAREGFAKLNGTEYVVGTTAAALCKTVEKFNRQIS